MASICAVAKGRSIGTIAEPHESSKKTKTSKDGGEFDTLQVMHFKLRTRDGVVYVGSKPKPGGDEALKKKFGDQYDGVRRVFEEALESWRGKEEKLDGAAFGMYERFRPSIKAWGEGVGKERGVEFEYGEEGL